MSDVSIRRSLAIFAAVLVVCAPTVASGDDVVELPRPHVELTSGDAIVTTVGGIKFRVPQGSHIIVPESYSLLDAEMKRLQEQEVRLTAENKSLRKTAAGWQPGWKILLSTAVVALATGAYYGAKL